jgi:16S rRNA (guanine966-N2)-methyltransferase
VLMDPPYGRGLADAALAQVVAASVVEPGGWVVVEHHVDDVLAQTYGSLQLTALRRYGKTAVALFSSSHRAEKVAAS